MCGICIVRVLNIFASRYDLLTSGIAIAGKECVVVVEARDAFGNRVTQVICVEKAPSLAQCTRGKRDVTEWQSSEGQARQGCPAMDKRACAISDLQLMNASPAGKYVSKTSSKTP